ncbi:MAG TPA: hypothetical protein ENK58_00625 [Desulfobacterales bacterium]|nr:MAG: hypothetical protein DRI57_08295 [Deltaproteobacteria bacterium]HHC23908.1 hypothetical protein [Desulfobacterales bacterium]
MRFSVLELSAGGFIPLPGWRKGEKNENHIGKSVKFGVCRSFEYLEGIPGMTESIAEGRKEDINDCATLKDIGWE